MDDRVRESDADRDGAAAALRGHFAAGRLDAGELDERLAAALSARTLGELHAVMADLQPAGAGQLGPARDRLERGYRRLLACYPAAWRRAHEQEMLAVLMTAAPEGKPRPGLGEAAATWSRAGCWCGVSEPATAQRLPGGTRWPS